MATRMWWWMILLSVVSPPPLKAKDFDLFFCRGKVLRLAWGYERAYERRVDCDSWTKDEKTIVANWSARKDVLDEYLAALEHDLNFFSQLYQSYFSRYRRRYERVIASASAEVADADAREFADGDFFAAFLQRLRRDPKMRERINRYFLSADDVTPEGLDAAIEILSVEGRILIVEQQFYDSLLNMVFMEPKDPSQTAMLIVEAANRTMGYKFDRVPDWKKIHRGEQGDGAWDFYLYRDDEAKFRLRLGRLVESKVIPEVHKKFLKARLEFLDLYGVPPTNSDRELITLLQKVFIIEQ